MKRLFGSVFLYLLVITAPTSAQTPAGAAIVTLSNPLDIPRPDEPIAWRRADLEKKLGPITPGKYLLLSDSAGIPIGIQFDDLDQDGHWDEIFFVHSFAPREKCRLQISVSDHPAAIKLVVRAHVRMQAKNNDDSFGLPLDTAVMPARNPPTDFSIHRLPPWLTEGPGWENDKVAYRLYFDTRNEKDIFGKRTPAMILDEVGVNPDSSYHELKDWGMDILKVANSLGAGSLAIYVPGKDRIGQDHNDTLIRLGGGQIKKETFHRISDGPLRAIFRMDYEWEIDGRPVSIREETTIGAGQYYYSSKVTIAGASADARLITGIANFYSNEPGNFQKDDAAVLYSHGRQSENKDTLGLAILVGKSDFSSFRSLPAGGSDVTSTYTVSQYIHKDRPLYFRFYTAWELTDPGFARMDYFLDMLRQEGDKFSHPVQVTW